MSNSDLATVQAQFKEYLLFGEREIESHIVSTQQLDNQTRLAIYGNAYYGRLEEVLEKDFPGVRALLGDELFYTVCGEYIQAHPSDRTSLNYFGRHMPQYLQRCDSARIQEYVVEMAKLEWLFSEAFYARDAQLVTEMDAVEVSAEYWPGLQIQLHPSVHWFDYRWNSLQFWQAMKQPQQRPPMQLLDTTQRCLVWRKALTTQFRTLDADESEIIDSVTKGANFSEMCEIVAAHQDSDADANNCALRAAGLLRAWINDEMVSALITESE